MKAALLRFAGDSEDVSPNDLFLLTLFAVLRTCLASFSSPNMPVMAVRLDVAIAFGLPDDQL